MNVAMIFQGVQLLLAIFREVHAIEAELPGAPGAAKSQAVIDKVTPIADVVGAHAEAVQNIITGVVSIANQSGIFKRSSSSAPAAAPAAAEGQQEAP